MGRSQKWPDLRSPISKIRDIRFVGTDNLIIFQKFHNFPWNIVAVARLESYFVVGSLDLTWWPDFTWPWVEIFTKVAENMGGKVGENQAALRAAVFSLSSNNLRGAFKRPPPAGRGLNSKISITLRHSGSAKCTRIPRNITKVMESVVKSLKIQRPKRSPANDSNNLIWAVPKCMIGIWRSEETHIY